MRRFLITSQKFTGTAAVLYNDKGTLCMIDCTQTDMEEMVISHFKHAVPATLHKLLNGNNFSSGTTIVEDQLAITFEMFYKDYPLKRNRYKVEKQWKKLSKTDQVKAFYSLHAYKKYLTLNSWLMPMIGDRYLRDKEYETDWNKI